MAARSGSRNTKSTNSRSKTNNRNKNTRGHNQKNQPSGVELSDEIKLVLILAVCIVLFLCNFGIVGTVGNVLSNIEFGIFGWPAYIAPVFYFLGLAFWITNRDNPVAVRKLVAAQVLFILAAMLCELFGGVVTTLDTYDFQAIYLNCSENHVGGGIIAGSLAYMLFHLLDVVGTALVLLVIGVICLIVLTERSLIEDLKRGGALFQEYSEDGAERRRERSDQRREASARRREELRIQREEQARERKERETRREQERLRLEEEERLAEQAKEDEKLLRMDKKVSGVMTDTQLHKPKSPDTKRRDDIHEIMLDLDSLKAELDQEEETEWVPMETVRASREVMPVPEERTELSDMHGIQFHGEYPDDAEFQENVTEVVPDLETPKTKLSEIHDEYLKEDPLSNMAKDDSSIFKKADRPKIGGERTGSGGVTFSDPVPSKSQSSTTQGVRTAAPATGAVQPAATAQPKPEKPKKYLFPPISLLAKPSGTGKGDSRQKLADTAAQLEKTLATFGVKVTVTDISQGPSVTRYEIQPEQGVKVSRIVGLSDDIKLNLAATDIRIEAPIPGKAAVGIEVPNKENMAVPLRDLLESKEFKDFQSNICFAVGKDIGGKTVVADIGKMPHMLIAGSTGSGKSVCINTIIMSILYKAHPDDVKMILIDPKVVELSVYNGIPHLLIPVVTDPKKASGALHWGVAEMTDRYQKFADFNVRDLKGYNKKVEEMQAKGDPQAPAKLPQIVIIVDELADLMMVAPGEVEESICRLAQLARAAGIHLIIATQRPSVDVITGLIKANMPSRVAFAVSSGVDSRTILDMNGAEKLLGKGDMLFYPQGYPKPARIQGAFVSDKEVSDVVDFLKNQAIGNVYSEDVETQIKNLGSGSGTGGSTGGGGVSTDELFVDVGRFIIEKDKASIGMLQRVFKIGFNRAARIMDQLADAGVVGEEEGTKPRKILMSPEQFEQYVEETL